jgi:hypothetical protein
MWDARPEDLVLRVLGSHRADGRNALGLKACGVWVTVAGRTSCRTSWRMMRWRKEARGPRAWPPCWRPTAPSQRPGTRPPPRGSRQRCCAVTASQSNGAVRADKYWPGQHGSSSTTCMRGICGCCLPPEGWLLDPGTQANICGSQHTSMHARAATKALPSFPIYE